MYEHVSRHVHEVETLLCKSIHHCQTRCRVTFDEGGRQLVERTIRIRDSEDVRATSSPVSFVPLKAITWSSKLIASRIEPAASRASTCTASPSA